VKLDVNINSSQVVVLDGEPTSALVSELEEEDEEPPTPSQMKPKPTISPHRRDRVHIESFGVVDKPQQKQ